MKLLHLDSSINGDESASREISAAIVARLREAHADLDVTYRDLAADPIPHLTHDTWCALGSGADVQQFLDTDIVVIGAGFYNFSIPSQLKAWIDRVVVKDRTFAYGPDGPVGLAAGKRVIVALARGNVYGPGSPYAAYEHAETLLRSIFGFVGATVEVIVAEGVARGGDARESAVHGALAKARDLSPGADAPVTND